jgi:galactokinase
MVQLVRSREKAGLYGARLTGAGCGGTVAVLGERTDRANEAIREIQRGYDQQTHLKSERLGP